MKLKRIMAIVLCFTMVLSTMSFSVFAEGEATELPVAVDGVITLTSDVTLAEAYTVEAGTELTIDLNGYKIKGDLADVSAGKHIYALKNYGTLTIKDSVGEGAIVSRGIYNYGTLTLKSGTIDACDGDGGYAVNNEENSTFTMDGGVVTASFDGGDEPGEGNYDATALDVPANCTVTLNGGEIKSVTNFTYAISNTGGELIVPEDSTIKVNGCHGAISTYGNGTTTINAGEFICDGAEGVSSDHVLYITSGTLTVNGGTFTNNNNDEGSNGAAVCVEEDVAEVEINNGTFTGCEAVIYGNINTVVNGGSYKLHWSDTFDTEDNLAQYVADGAKIVVDGIEMTKTDSGLKEDTSATETVVATVDGVSYTDLQAALDAAAAGEGDVMVEILENVDLTNVEWVPVLVSAPNYPVVTVNGNGKVITGLDDMLFSGTWAGGSGLIINDLTIKDSAIVNDKDDTKGTVGVGAFIGFPQASATVTLDNCHLINSSVEGGHWTGGLIGYAAGYAGNDGPVFMNLTINECSVTGSTITGKGSAGGIIGHATGNAWTQTTITDTTVSNNTVASIGSSTNKAGAVIGTIGAAGQATTVNGVEKNGGVSVAATVSGNNVTSNSATITTIYGRQGTDTGMLYVTGGEYDEYPIEENVAYAAPIEGYEIADNGDGTYGVIVDPAYGMAAKIGDTYYETIQAAINAAQNGETVEILPGEYDPINISNKNITIKGTVGNDGELLTTIKGGNPAITGHSFNGTIKDIKIVDAWKVMYAEPAGNVTVDNVYVTGATYGFHLVAHSPDLTWTIQNSYMDLRWANSFGVAYDGYSDIIIKGNRFEATNPYYSDYGAIHVNSFLPSVTVEENIFGENAKIYIDASVTDTSKINISKNYHADGVENAFADDAEGVTVPIYQYYTGVDEEGNLTDLVVITPAVAKIGDVEYGTLEEAIAAAQNGDTITLLGDVELTNPVVISGKSLTLDLGEYTICDKSTSVLTSDGDIWGLIALENSAKLTICGNGTIDCNYQNVSGGWTGMAYCINVDATSELTVNGGNFVNGNGGIQTLGKVTVNNGTFVSHNGGTCIMALRETANVTVNDGIFKDSIEESDVYTGSGAVWSGFGATVTINGGTYDFAADPEHNDIVWTLFPAQNAIAGQSGQNANMTVTGGTFINFNPTTDVVVDYSPSTGFKFGSVVADGCSSLESMDGKFFIGTKPTATVNDLGKKVIPANEYMVYGGDSADADMPLNFVMQFVADQNEEDMETSPYAEWYADFVITVSGLENGSFVANGCYLAGYYEPYGWVKVPIDGMTIEEGVRYPVMLGVGLGQKYEYICSGVKDFRCAMFLTEEVLAQNPELKVNLELAVVDNSEGGEAAAAALQDPNSTKVLKVESIEYTAEDFEIKEPVAQIGETKYATLEEAITEAQANDTIILLADVTEDVTIGKSITLDGGNFKYTGNISVSGSTSEVTVKNVNFENGTGYAITTNRIKSITVEDCTVNNYGYGFLYANKSTPTVVVKNVTVDGGNYGFHWVYGTSATLEKVTMTNVTNCLLIQNYAGKTVTLKNCNLTNINIWERDGYSGVQTFKFEGSNTVSTLSTSQYAKYVLAAADATLTAPEGVDVTTDLEGYLVKYVDGTYKAVKAVAQIDETKYETFEEAITAAEDGDVVTLLSDVVLDAPVTIKKSITIDGNGHSITQSAECNNNIALLYFEGAADKVLDVAVENTTFDGLKVGAAIRTLYANMNIDNCVFQNCEHTVGQGIVRLTYGTANITNSKFLNNDCSMGISFNWDGNGLATDTLTVNNCEFTGNIANKTALIYYVKGVGCEIKNSEFKNNTVNCNANGATIYLGFTENNVVTANLFENNEVIEATGSTRVGGAIFFGYKTDISGNAFINNTASNANGDALGQVCTSTYYECDIDLGGNYWGGDAPVYGKDFTVQHQTGDATFSLDTYNASYSFDENGNVVVADETLILYAAQAGKLGYTDFQSAIDNANGKTVTVLENIALAEEIVVPADTTVTLDLNGKTITGTDNATGSFALIEVQPDAELTINDTSAEKSGKITLTSTNNRGWNAYSSVISNQRGKLTVNGGTIEHLGGTDMAYGIDNLTNTGAQNAETIINGGTIKSTYRAIRQFLNSTKAQNILTINGGTVEGTNKSIWMQDANASANPGVLTVAEDATLNGDVYLTVTEGSTEWPVEVSIAAAALDSESKVLTNDKVPEGYEVVLENGYYGVQEKENAEMLFKIAGTDATLGSSLALNFYWEKLGEITADSCYAVVEQEKETGTITTTITSDNWETNNNYLVVGYDKIAAKEMADVVKMTIYYADGTPASETYVTSIRDYAIKAMEREEADSLWLPAIIDLLNYGAAAQEEFEYNLDDLATKGAENFQEYASEGYDLSGEGCSATDAVAGRLLSLKSVLQLEVYFKNVTEGMYATYSYTTYAGTKRSGRVEYDSLVKLDDYHGVTVGISIANADALVTVKLFDSNDNELGTAVYSANEYLKYQIESEEYKDDPIYPALAKVAASAKKAFLAQ